MLNAIGNKLLQGDYGKVVFLGVLLVAGVALLYLLRKRIFALVDQMHLRREEHASSKPE